MNAIEWRNVVGSTERAGSCAEQLIRAGDANPPIGHVVKVLRLQCPNGFVDFACLSRNGRPRPPSAAAIESKDERQSDVVVLPMSRAQHAEPLDASERKTWKIKRLRAASDCH